jgi:hypothetical protein
MSVLTMTPKHWYSWDFSVLEGARRLADVHLSSWREKGVLSVDGVDYHVFRESLLGDFLLQHAGSVLARASKPSAFQRSFILRYKEKPYTLRADSAFRRSFVLFDGSAEMGSIVPESAWTRKAQVTLPDDWPLPLKSFAIWLTIVHWKREAS